MSAYIMNSDVRFSVRVFFSSSLLCLFSVVC